MVAVHGCQVNPDGHRAWGGHQGSSADPTFPVSWGWDHPAWMCQRDCVLGAGLDLLAGDPPHCWVL